MQRRLHDARGEATRWEEACLKERSRATKLERRIEEMRAEFEAMDESKRIRELEEAARSLREEVELHKAGDEGRVAMIKELKTSLSKAGGKIDQMAGRIRWDWGRRWKALNALMSCWATGFGGGGQGDSTYRECPWRTLLAPRSSLLAPPPRVRSKVRRGTAERRSSACRPVRRSKLEAAQVAERSEFQERLRQVNESTEGALREADARRQEFEQVYEFLVSRVQRLLVAKAAFASTGGNPEALVDVSRTIASIGT